MDQFDLIKADLDKQLASSNSDVGIAFGDDLFREFKKRNWFTLETFGAQGTSLFPTKVPAYNKTHFAFTSWNIDSLAFLVGSVTK